MNAARIITFWFEETSPKQWYRADPVFDETVRARFEPVHLRARACELWPWRETPHGRLAEIIVLDQFSRNMYRGTAQAFAFDALALALAQEAVARGADRALDAVRRAFVYMPYMHSESLAVHDQALALFSQPGLEGNLDFERRHRQILERFGRYPHRNAVLGRISTPEEIEFLKQPGSGF